MVSFVVALAGSPSTSSRTVGLVELFAGWLREGGHEVRVVPVRALPAEALLGADAGDPLVADAVAAVAAADGVIAGSPVYKAAYSGVLKTFLDLLPHGALTGKTVLPLLTGGAPVHALAVDYALRPVLSALGARHVVPGIFVLDKQIERTPGGVVLAKEVRTAIESAVADFAAALPVTATLPATASMAATRAASVTG
jgi:FMN reductase